MLERFLHNIWKPFPQKCVGELSSWKSNICAFQLYKLKLFYTHLRSVRNDPKSWSTGAQQLCPATPLGSGLGGSALLTPCWGLRLLRPSSTGPPRPALVGTEVWCSSISSTPEVSLPPLFSRCMSCCHSSHWGQPERSRYWLKHTLWGCRLLNGMTGRPLKMRPFQCPSILIPHRKQCLLISKDEHFSTFHIRRDLPIQQQSIT